MCLHLSVCCIVCCTTSGLGVKPSRMVPVEMENSPYFHSPLFLNSFSCTPQQGSLLYFTSYKIHPPPLFCRMPALNRKLFPADMGVNLARNGGKSAFLWWLHFKSNPATSCPHFFSFFHVLLLSLSIFLSPPIFLQVPWLLMVPQHASPLLWGHSVLLHSSLTGFCSTKDVTISCCVLQATSKEDTKIQGAEGGRWRRLLLD